MLMAMGVPIAAAALFDTILVMTVMSSMNALRIIGGGRDEAALTKLTAIKSAIPVPSSALPSASAVTMIMTTGIDSEAAASRQLRQPEAIITPSPTSALTEIGMMPSAAARTTKPMIVSARLA